MTVLVSTHYMDEAERCHEIAYIAYGELLAQGTIEEVIEQVAPQDLHGQRPRPAVAGREAAGIPGIDMVAPFGTEPARRRPRSGRARHGGGQVSRPPRRCTGRLSQPSLEDVFIDLMSRSQDNFQ